MTGGMNPDSEAYSIEKLILVHEQMRYQLERMMHRLTLLNCRFFGTHRMIRHDKRRWRYKLNRPFWPRRRRGR